MNKFEAIKQYKRAAELARRDGNWAVADAYQSIANALARGTKQSANLPPASLNDDDACVTITES